MEDVKSGAEYDMLEKMGARTRPTGWKWYGDETYFLIALACGLANLFMSFYVLVWYSYLELRQTTPKELAAALNRGTLVELAFTVPLAVLFIYGGYLWESIALCCAAAWLVIRFALGWTEMEGSEVHERSRFRQAEAYTKMALFFLVLVYSLTRVIMAMEEAYSTHHHMMKHLGPRGRGGMF